MAATFVVEDGNGLPDANAYVSLDYANDYFASRGVAAWASVADSDKQTAIVRATDYIETVFGPKFTGSKAFVSCPPDPTVDQALSFPRDNRIAFIGNANYSDIQFLDFGNDAFKGAPLTKPVIMPPALLKGCCEYAFRAITNAALLSDPKVDASGNMIIGKTTTVGPITTSLQFYPNSIQIVTDYPAADLLLRTLCDRSGRAIRG
jgi:DnaT-like ssDNA binding protein